jgi:hypothetical protein
MVIALVASFFVYRPDRSLPFDFLDFSEFLPLLQGADTFSARFSALFDYYVGDHGRLSVVAYALLAAKWGILGVDSPAWQWMRFATMWTIVVLTFLLLRQLRFSQAASLVGASLFLFAPPAVEGWVRLTMAEPKGTILLLLLCLIAIARWSGPEWTAGLTFGLISVILVLLKEMMAATLILPLALSVIVGRAGDGRRRPRASTIAVSAIAATAAAGIPVAIAALLARDGSYTGDYGSTLRPVTDVLAQWTLAWLPFDPGAAFPPRLTGLALLTTLALLIAGWRYFLRGPTNQRSRSRHILAVSLLFPLSGVMLYLPWPAYNRFYAIPYLLGGALLAAGAFSGIATRSRLALRIASGVWITLIVFAAGDAAARARRTAARQVLNARLVQRLAQLSPQTDTVWIATDQRAPAEWQGVGPTLQRYGVALGYEMPHLVNAPCEESRQLASQRRGRFVFYSSLCPAVTTGEVLVERYRRIALPAVRPRPDSIRIDIVVPESAASTRSGS